MFKAAIFDMDGVIIDSEPFHWDVNKKIFSDLGIKVSQGEYRRYIGSSNTNMWTDLKKRYGLSQPLEALVNMQGSGNIDFLRENPFDPIPGISELIQDLKKNGKAIGLASSSPHVAIDIVLKKFAFESYFSVVVSGEDFKNSKPAPDIFLKAARLLNMPADECVVIEDASHGVAAAKAAGMKCVGFENKNSWGQDLSGADLIVDDIKKLNTQRIQTLFTIF